MASNEHVDWSKIENFLRSNCYPEDISNGESKKTNFRKNCKNFKTIDGHPTY